MSGKFKKCLERVKGRQIFLWEGDTGRIRSVIKTLVRVFISIDKKPKKFSQISCSTRRFASSQLRIISLARFHVQSVGSHLHKYG